jgi:hypothetical protein
LKALVVFSVVYGHCPEENQVSNTSVSCVKFFEPQREHCVGCVLDTIGGQLGLSQYHIGIGIPQ